MADPPPDQAGVQSSSPSDAQRLPKRLAKGFDKEGSTDRGRAVGPCPTRELTQSGYGLERHALRLRAERIAPGEPEGEPV